MRCLRCLGFGVLPNRMDAEGGPRCSCGTPSLYGDGSCGAEHAPVPCDCEDGRRVAERLARRRLN